MADFSTEATQLSGPRGAGAEVVAPVTVNPMAAPMQALEGLTNIFVKGLQSDQKAQIAERKRAAVQSYVKSETNINEAFANGKITPAEAKIRSQANFNMHAGNNAEYIEDFEKAGKALRGFTEAGEVQDAVSLAADIRKKRRDQAITKGFTFVDGMSPAQEEVLMRAAETGITLENETRRFIQDRQEARASATYNREAEERLIKDHAKTTLSTLANTNVSVLQSMGEALYTQVKAGKKTFEEATADLNRGYVNIDAALTAASMSHPELAAQWKTIFSNINDINHKMIDPKADTERLTAQLTALTTKATLMAAEKQPGALAAIVTNKLFPMTPGVALQAQQASTGVYSLLATTKLDGGEYKPQVVGNPYAEADVLKLGRAAFKDLSGGKILDDKAASEQGQNLVNNLLEQTGKYIHEQGVDPKRLSKMADFIASPEYGNFVNKNLISPEANRAAKEVFQMKYEPSLIRGVQQMLSTPLTDVAYGAGTKGTPIEVADAFDIQWNGTGISFVPKSVKGMTPAQLSSQKATLQQLESSKNALNQMIRMGSHLEFSVDYKKTWEDNRHIFLPGYYMEGLKEGDVRNGYKYLGGNASSQRSWLKVSDGGAK